MCVIYNSFFVYGFSSRMHLDVYTPSMGSTHCRQVAKRSQKQFGHSPEVSCWDVRKSQI